MLKCLVIITFTPARLVCRSVPHYVLQSGSLVLLDDVMQGKEIVLPGHPQLACYLIALYHTVNNSWCSELLIHQFRGKTGFLQHPHNTTHAYLL